MTDISMQPGAVLPLPVSRLRGRSLALILLALLAALAGFFAFRGRTVPLTSAETLAKNYGIQINLVAVTGAGGLVDLRLKVLDVEKARLLLGDKENYPVLVVTGSGAVLQLPPAARPEIKLEEGGNLFFMFPNAGSAVKTGAQVNIRFGDMTLEPMIVK